MGFWPGVLRLGSALLVPLMRPLRLVLFIQYELPLFWPVCRKRPELFGLIS